MKTINTPSSWRFNSDMFNKEVGKFSQHQYRLIWPIILNPALQPIQKFNNAKQLQKHFFSVWQNFILITKSDLYKISSSP